MTLGEHAGPTWWTGPSTACWVPLAIPGAREPLSAERAAGRTLPPRRWKDDRDEPPRSRPARPDSIRDCGRICALRSPRSSVGGGVRGDVRVDPDRPPPSQRPPGVEGDPGDRKSVV